MTSTNRKTKSNPRGVGRPPISPRLVKKPLGTKLPQWLLDWLRDQDEPIAILIEQALCKQHKLIPPK